MTKIHSIYNNKTQYFGSLPDVWNFYIEGYQVCQETIRIMDQINELISGGQSKS